MKDEGGGNHKSDEVTGSTKKTGVVIKICMTIEISRRNIDRVLRAVYYRCAEKCDDAEEEAVIRALTSKNQLKQYS